MEVAAVLAAVLPVVAGHAQMQHPPPRSATGVPNTLAGAGECLGGGCLFFSQGCQPGCSNCTDTFGSDTCSEPGKTMEPTLNDKELRTYKDLFDNATGKMVDWTRSMPWRSPGHSPVFSPCGIDGGGKTLHPANGAFPVGKSIGTDGRSLEEGPKTVWRRGEAADVAWSITANHGGGCKCPPSRRPPSPASLRPLFPCR